MKRTRSDTITWIRLKITETADFEPLENLLYVRAFLALVYSHWTDNSRRFFLRFFCTVLFSLHLVWFSTLRGVSGFETCAISQENVSQLTLGTALENILDLPLFVLVGLISLGKTINMFDWIEIVYQSVFCDINNDTSEKYMRITIGWTSLW